MTISGTLTTTDKQTRTLRVAMVAPSLDILGGQGVQASDLMRGLLKEGFQVDFIAVNPSFPRGLGWLRRVPVLRTLLNQLLYIPSLHRLRHADVVHVFSASYWSFLLAPVPAIVASKLFGKRVLLNYHSGEADDHLANWGRRVHPWLRKVDEIVVPSPYLRKVFESHGYSARVILNVVNTSNFVFRERKPLKPRLISVRNLESHYCVSNNLKAFALVKRRWPEATLKVIGYGSQEHQLKQWVKEQGLEGIEFLGRVEPQHMPAAYDGADIFINSSVVDNQPLSILEAFASGTLVVSTPTGGIADMVHHQESGLLVPPNDPQAMADAVNLALGDPVLAQGLMRKGREESGKYTWAQVSRQWSDLYKKGDR